MNREEIEAKLKEIEEEQLRLRRRFNELQDIVQNAPGSHTAGAPSPAVINAEREIHSVVLAICDLDRRRQELTVAASIGG